MQRLAWLNDAPCRDHPKLKPDAWYELNHYGIPNEVGKQALAVCFACPVKQQCKLYMGATDVRATIAGGGWFDNHGRFHEYLPREIVNTTGLAHLLGISQETIRHLVRLGVVPTAGTAANGWHAFDVAKVLAKTDQINERLKELTEWEKTRKAKAEAKAERRRQRRRLSSCSSSAVSSAASSR